MDILLRPWGVIKGFKVGGNTIQFAEMIQVAKENGFQRVPPCEMLIGVPRRKGFVVK